MPRATNKRKQAGMDSGDELPPARQEKAPRTRKKTVKFAENVQAVPYEKHQQIKSILKATSSPSLITSELLKTPNPSPPTPEPFEQNEEEDFDQVEIERTRMVAAAATKLAKSIEKERRQQEFVAVQKQLALTQNELENSRLSEKHFTIERDKAKLAIVDANKRAESSEAELKKALLAIGRLENKIKTLEGQLKKPERGLLISAEVDAEPEKSLAKNTVKETVEEKAEETAGLEYSVAK